MSAPQAYFRQRRGPTVTAANANRDGGIDAKELTAAFLSGDGDPMPEDAGKELIANNDGLLNLEEFAAGAWPMIKDGLNEGHVKFADDVARKIEDATIKESLGDLVTGEKMYLYLVDKLTGEPRASAELMPAAQHQGTTKHRACR